MGISETIADLASMRTRDLKRLLSKLGAEKSLLSKLLDKAELIALATQLLNEEQQSKNTAVKTKWAYYITIALGFLLLLFVAKDIVLAVISSLISFLSQELFQIKIKLRTMKMALKHRRIYGIVGLILSIVCDILLSSIQFSILASWVIPRESTFRRYLISTFSLPMTPQQVLGFGSGTFAIDVGPMITIWALRWVSKQLGELVGQQLIDIVDRKNLKRMNRKPLNKNSYDSTNTFFKYDSIFVSKKQEEDTLDGLKRRFFSIPRSENEGNYSPSNPPEDEEDGDKEVLDDGKKSILEARNDGSEEILEDALADGSSLICEMCLAVISKERWDAHRTVWCSSISEDIEGIVSDGATV